MGTGTGLVGGLAPGWLGEWLRVGWRPKRETEEGQALGSPTGTGTGLVGHRVGWGTGGGQARGFIFVA